MGLFHVGYTILDADGDKSTFAVKVPQGTLTLANITEFAQELSVLVDAVTDGQITEISCILQVALAGSEKGAPIALSEVQKGGHFAFSANGTPYRHSVRVPALTPSKFVGNVVDTADSDIIAFVNAMTAGLDASGTQVQPSDKYENDITALIEAVKSFRRK